MTSILFLDIDGVLNTRASMMRAAEGDHPPKAMIDLGRFFTVDRACVARLRDVVEETGAEIVLSSTWRYNPGHTEKALAWAGWSDPPIIGATTTEEIRSPGGLYIGQQRGAQIAQWLAGHPCERYAIVDDDSDMLEEQMPYFVKTTFEEGLTAERAEDLRALLTDKQPCGCGLTETCICYTR